MIAYAVEKNSPSVLLRRCGAAKHYAKAAPQNTCSREVEFYVGGLKKFANQYLPKNIDEK